MHENTVSLIYTVANKGIFISTNLYVSCTLTLQLSNLYIENDWVVMIGCALIQYILEDVLGKRCQ